MAETEPVACRVSYLFSSDLSHFILNADLMWSVSWMKGKKKKKSEAVEVYLLLNISLLQSDLYCKGKLHTIKQ